MHLTRASSIATAAAATVPATTAAVAVAGVSPPAAAAETAALGALTEAGREVVLQVVLPLLVVWLLQQWLERLEERTLQEVKATQPSAAEDEAAAAASTSTSSTAAAGAAAPRRTASSGASASPHPARRRTSLLRRLFSGLPSAPSRLALIALTVTHVARSLAEINKRLAERGLAEGWMGSPTLATYVLGSGRGADVVEAMGKAMAALDHGLLTLYKVLLVGVCTWVVVSWKDVMLSRFLLRRSQHHAGEDLERILTPLNTVATWALVVCAVVVVVSLVGVDVRPLLVLTGGGGVVAGLASQQLLSNAVSGLQMYMDRPFRVGDTISIPGVEGEVVDLSALRTHVLTSDGCIVAIPNGSLAEMVITNKSQSSRGGVRPPWMETRTPLSVTLLIRLRPATYDRMWVKMDDLKTAIINTGAVEAIGKSAPILEVQSFTDRGVMVQARVTLRNPYKGPAMASSLLAKPTKPAAPAAPKPPASATPAITKAIVASTDDSKPAAAAAAQASSSAAAAAAGNGTGVAGKAAAAASALGDADWVSFATPDGSASAAFTAAHTLSTSTASNNGTGPSGSAAGAAAVAEAASNNGVQAPPSTQQFPGGLPTTTTFSNYFWPPSGAASGTSSSAATPAAASADSGVAASAGISAIASAPAPGATAAAPAATTAATVGSSSAGGAAGSSSSSSSKAGKSSQQPQQDEGVSRETVRVMRQQLLLNLGPWLQAHNATLMLGD
ncbi:hypothetical protein HYH02_006491 [Chlamydomonas schloesseri]|uniref:Mechanosensitive ion channel MscS domain-containing protein n=1 Tax=Chlamydomonas schloesseri TaxID=2026947 RepID=A0A835WJI1_9CHLO|nr:hypothetical protein HYH02_006491 [Chlamydomonas schloesseri]|eukprot:KAG2448600.1 hypothetical protein HYH02_006491 [Chlamydomonas schloesseri]